MSDKHPLSRFEKAWSRDLNPHKDKALQKPLLQACDLTCMRGELTLFSELNFSLTPGSAMVVEGRNGSGKTSLLHILCGLLNPDDGEVRYRDRPIREVREEYHKDLAYIGHVHGLKGDLTPEENLRVAQALAAVAPRTPPEMALAHLGLDSLSHLLCRELSFGQRRRVALARLVMSRASLWILDEPMAGIDRSGVERIEALFREHVHAGGSLILSSHQTLVLQGICLDHVHLGSMNR